MSFDHPHLSTGFASLTRDDLAMLKDVSVVDRLQITYEKMTPQEKSLLSE